jgi:hypothetical protein
MITSVGYKSALISRLASKVVTNPALLTWQRPVSRPAAAGVVR